MKLLVRICLFPFLALWICIMLISVLFFGFGHNHWYIEETGNWFFDNF